MEYALHRVGSESKLKQTIDCNAITLLLTQEGMFSILPPSPFRKVYMYKHIYTIIGFTKQELIHRGFKPIGIKYMVYQERKYCEVYKRADDNKFYLHRTSTLGIEILTEDLREFQERNSPNQNKNL